MTWPHKIRVQVVNRSGGVCEGCGKREASDIHHRQFKSRGGKDIVQNAILLCGWGNNANEGWCHGRAHNDPGAVIDGWTVASWDDPKSKPVMYRGQWAYLLDRAPWIEPLGLVVF
jgi:hypothetical protein